jgi:hypothetical protein
VKDNSTIRREALARLREGPWFCRLFAVTLFFCCLQRAVASALAAAYERYGIQTWFDFLQAKAEAVQSGLSYAVPSRAVAWQMHEATAFHLFISLVFAGISYHALAGANLRAAGDEPSGWARAAFGALARPLADGWLAFVFAGRVFFWSLLLIIPGVVASYRYSQVWNVRAEHPDWPAGPCLAESARLMDGRKLQRFLLDLSFVGWILLATLLIGCSLAARFVNWILPLSPFLLLAVAMWMSLARAIFYREVKNARPQTPDQAEVVL